MDAELLAEYAANGSEAAFVALVERYIGLVYSAALRQVGDAHLAEEITQTVFILLARKAGHLNDKAVLSGWLCRTAHFVACDTLKADRRRREREQFAAMNLPSSQDAWEQLMPLLDESVARLRETDRAALILRFYEQKSLDEVGAALGVSANTANKRIARALEKLRKLFIKRGVALPSAVIASTVAAHSVQAAPAALAQTISAVALTKGAAASTSTLTLIKGTLKIMAWTKAKTAIAAGVAVLFIAPATVITVKQYQEHRTYPWQVENLNTQILDDAEPQVRIVPTKFFKQPGFEYLRSNKGAIGLSAPVGSMVEFAYLMNNHYIVYETDLPTNRYDFIAKSVASRSQRGNTNWTVELQKLITKKFGITGKLEMRDMDVLILHPGPSGVHGIKVSDPKSKRNGYSAHENKIEIHGYSLDILALHLQDKLNIPIIDKSGLKGKEYDYSFSWGEKGLPPLSELDSKLNPLFRDQLGLELVPTNMPIEMLVVKKLRIKN